jgi:hypothetical protein
MTCDLLQHVEGLGWLRVSSGDYLALLRMVRCEKTNGHLTATRIVRQSDGVTLVFFEVVE